MVYAKSFSATALDRLRGFELIQIRDHALVGDPVANIFKLIDHGTLATFTKSEKEWLVERIEKEIGQVIYNELKRRRTRIRPPSVPAIVDKIGKRHE
jgi:hypothetical protein